MAVPKTEEVVAVPATVEAVVAQAAAVPAKPTDVEKEVKATPAPTSTPTSTTAEASIPSTDEESKNVADAEDASKVEEAGEASSSDQEQDKSEATPVEPSIPEWKEESNLVSDLKDSEKKALEEFKLRIQKAIQDSEFKIVKKVVKAAKEPESAKAPEPVVAPAEEAMEEVAPVETKTETAAVEVGETSATPVTAAPAAVEEKAREVSNPTPAPAVAEVKVAEKAAPVEPKVEEKTAVVVNKVVVKTPVVVEKVEVKAAAPAVAEKVVEKTSAPKIEEKIAEKTAAAKVEEKAVEKTAAPLVADKVEEKIAAPVVAAPAAEKRAEEVPVIGATSTSVADVAEAVIAQAAEAAAVEGAEAEAEEELEDSTTPEDICLWGVPLLYTKGDKRTDVVLLKFLRAREFSVKDAFNQLKKTIIWRKTFNADNLLNEEFAPELDGVAYMHGETRDGHPVCYNVYGAFQDKELYQKTFGDSTKLATFLRWRVQVLEKGIQLLNFTPEGPSAMVQITDLKNAPGPTKKDVKNAANQAVTLLQDNYPELSSKRVFINVPRYFSAMYAVISPLLSKRTKSKFVVAPAGNTTECLMKLISADNIPIQYGGLSRLNETEFTAGSAPVHELVLKGGKSTNIDIEVTEVGSTVVWDLAVIGYDVTYAAEFVPSAEGSYSIILEKSKKLPSSTEEPVRNSFKVTTPGKVVLNVTNLSRKKKTIIYRSIVKGTTTAAVVSETS
ncbi:hypothetical protein Mapa_005695 [Marchantia paleacea]|nr:hypothetical protein Mapa_005695 [Marchantia paleacea]